ncbi:MAG: extracellular solute-binding protein [Thermomicrobiales bacterium]|nr:extracellular solute-binding protein [Thermomicrobiales bacterium]MCO5220948.1 extracellular solute-binding protein [Thermomicrobiales bacterium]
MIEFEGVSWDHPRGHDCIVATSEAYTALHPEVSFKWTTRSLQDFADYPIGKLSERNDFIVLDHPFMGVAATSGCLLPLDEWIGADALADQRAHTVGPSFESYRAGGHYWAMAIDAACQVASFRPDLLERDPPRTWDDVVTLAESRSGKSTAQVAHPLIPVDTLMTFLTICAVYGEPAARTPERFAGNSVGAAAWETMLRLSKTIHPMSKHWNPIRTYDRMCESDEIAYVPAAFGYSNYAREGFREKTIGFAATPQSGEKGRGGVLGGAGLSISARTKHPEVAADFAVFAASGPVQSGIYVTSGGQPGHIDAWTSDEVNALCGNFFADTLQGIASAYLRPRYLGFMEFQDRAGMLMHQALFAGEAAGDVLSKIEALYHSSNPNFDI